MVDDRRRKRCRPGLHGLHGLRGLPASLLVAGSLAWIGTLAPMRGAGPGGETASAAASRTIGRLSAVTTALAPGAATRTCTPGARVAVLGADLSPGGRFEVQRALAVGPHTVQLTETLAAERAQAGGLIPPALLTQVAVSSGLLHPLPPGAGLRVTVNPAITLDTPQTYANALLTAGVTDADVGVAAPTRQPAFGTTALLGVLRAARAACLALDPAREALAIREVVLASQLAAAPSVGRQRAPLLLFALKGAATAQQLTAPAALAALIVHDGRAQGTPVPPSLVPAVVTYLHDLVAASAYRRVLSRHPAIVATAPRAVRIHLQAARAAGTGRAAATVVPPTPVPPTPRPATPVPSQAGVWQGTVVGVSGRSVTIHTHQGTATYQAASGVPVTRNSQASSLGALRAGDAITLTTDAAGVATAIVATAPLLVAQPTQSPLTGGLLDTLLTALAGLVFLLLLIPLLVGRRRQHSAGAPGGVPAQGVSGSRARPHPAGQAIVFSPGERAHLVDKGTVDDT